MRSTIWSSAGLGICAAATNGTIDDVRVYNRALSAAASRAARGGEPPTLYKSP
jgi:hypothetical protein